MRRTHLIHPASAKAMVLACGLLPVVAGSVGCKSFSEAYIRLEVWKYERCFGHLPPGFVPNAAPAPMAGPAMPPCGQPAPCAGGPAPCGPAAGPMMSGGCDGCSGGTVGGTVIEGHAPGVPVGAPAATPAGVGVPSPAPAGAVTTSKPVVISDEVVLP